MKTKDCDTKFSNLFLHQQYYTELAKLELKSVFRTWRFIDISALGIEWYGVLTIAIKLFGKTTKENKTLEKYTQYWFGGLNS